MDLVGWALDLIDRLGGAGVALVLAAENLVAMIPGEILLPFVGMLAEQNGYGLAWAIGWTTAGSVAGAYVIYGAGRLLGRQRATRLLLKVPLTEAKDIDRADAFFERYGAWAVVFVRWIPMLRAFISLPAGTHGMGAVKFGVMTAIGSGTWNAVFVVAGYYLGRRGSALVDEVVTTYSLVLGILGAIVVALLLTLRIRRRRRERTAGPDAPATVALSPEPDAGPAAALEERRVDVGASAEGRVGEQFAMVSQVSERPSG